MFIEPMITYSEFLSDNPTFWNDRLSNGDIDAATVASIEKWFRNRVVCDDFKFDNFFDRQLDLVLPRYNKLIRLENTEFDALVSIYRERQVTDTGSESGTENNSISKEGENSKSGTVTTVRTPNLRVEDSGTTSSSSSTDTTSHSEGGTTSSGETGNSSVSKQNPQSISYGTAVAGEIPALDWSYPSSQQQSKGTNSGGTTSENDGTGSSDTTQSGTSGNVQTTTGTDTTEQTSADSGTISNTETSEKGTSITTSNLKREIFTGRDNLTPQDALREAMSYVKQSSAFAWLKDSLEICFLSVYDI